MSSRKQYQQKAAEEINSLSTLKRYLCSMATGGLRQPQNKRVEAACAACGVQCEYGKRWLEIFWAEEDRKWEREHRDREKEQQAVQIARLKNEYEEMCRERAIYEAGGRNNRFLQEALRPTGNR